MKVTVIGTGYVGLVTGACLSEMGKHVLGLDVDERNKIEILNSGGIPIHEPGLEQMVKRNAADGRLQFTTDVVAAAHYGTLQFSGVGTPPDEDGSADLQYGWPPRSRTSYAPTASSSTPTTSAPSC